MLAGPMRRLEEPMPDGLSPGDPAPVARVSRRQALKTYVPPTIAVIGLANVTSLGWSGPTKQVPPDEVPKNLPKPRR